MPYTWDVFLSYRRRRQYVDWIDDFFLHRFKDKVSENLPPEWGEVKVFVDRQAIEPGEDWPKELADALGGSRCLVPLWASDYFGSRWCYSEWQNFHRSGRKIVPIQWSNHTRFFPVEAQRMQAADFSLYTLTGEGFRKTEEFVRYQTAIATFAESVAQVLIDLPAEPTEFSFTMFDPPTGAARNNRLMTISPLPRVA
jgi:hypothetical protein